MSHSSLIARLSIPALSTMHSSGGILRLMDKGNLIWKLLILWCVPTPPLPTLPLGTRAPSYASHQYFPHPPKMQSALRLTLLVEWGRGEGVRSCSWKPPHGWALDWLLHSHYRSIDNSYQLVYFKLQTNSTISLRVIQSSTIPKSFFSCSSLVQTLQGVSKKSGIYFMISISVKLKTNCWKYIQF